MPRDLVVGNGKILATFDSKLNMRDLYYPYVGQMNHIMGHKNRIGVWVEGQFRWLEHESWENHLDYCSESLVTDVISMNRELSLELGINDAIHYRHNLFLRRVTLKNLVDRSREVRTFFSHDFSINQTDVGDTALFNPEGDTLLHYKFNRIFLISASQRGGGEDKGIFQYATGIKRFGGAEGTWRDAEDGVLECNPIAQGSVDSVISVRTILPPLGDVQVWYWIVVGESWPEVQELDCLVREQGLDSLLHETQAYWRTWVNKSEIDFANLPQPLVDLYKRSLLIIRTQIDAGGAIIAANDSDIMETNRDHYSYVWPRDGALVAYALDKAGYSEISKRFFSFCTKLLSFEGFFWQKYNPDGSVGSSWHPWIKAGKPQVPIQEDETALVLWALWHYYQLTRDLEFIEELYTPLICKAADFLVEYRDPVTKLPEKSYDLWEERQGIFTFTAAAVFGALRGAANFARLFGHHSQAVKYELAATEVKQGIISYLFDPEKNRFLRGGYPSPEGLVKDYTLDSSVAGIFAFGVLSPRHQKVVSTMEFIRKGLWVKGPVGGVARYTNDYYHQVSQNIHDIPGNPWFITTLWLAEWLIAKAESLSELAPALEILHWCNRYTSPAGIMAEQINPLTGDPLSVSPLTWSHSTYVLVVQKYLSKFHSLRSSCYGKQEEVEGMGKK